MAFVSTFVAGMAYQFFDELAKVVHLRFGKDAGDYLVGIGNGLVQPALGFKRIFGVFAFHDFLFLGEVWKDL
ncbi:hypothetical protein GCM10027516_38430 [Niabella aquatica]